MQERSHQTLSEDGQKSGRIMDDPAGGMRQSFDRAERLANIV
jgi:hypothetical protein